MKKLILGVLASITMLVSSSVFAQEQDILDAFPPMPVPPALPGLVVENEPFVINVKAICGTIEHIKDILSPAEEKVFAKMVAARSSGPIPFPGNPAPAVMTLNPATGSWSIIENLAPGVYCMTASGFGMTPFNDPGQKINYKK